MAYNMYNSVEDICTGLLGKRLRPYNDVRKKALKRIDVEGIYLISKLSCPISISTTVHMQGLKNAT